ncbi:taste receptor type 2 member 40-like [Phyllobates terribilis]|uniref:taste receptor type 2 member 40-like n=1 Tax=Phyllobates terribilis TaxID=111132 RepID=UPI003CCAB721
MISALRLLRLILLILTGISGTLLNSSAMVLYFVLWRRMSDWCNYNGILLVISLVNLFYQWCLTVDNVFKYSEIYEMFDERLCLVLFSLQFALVGVSLWNTTWLCIFYCARLVSSSHWLLLRIKEKFFSFLPQLMAGSVVWSVAITMPLFWATSKETAENQTDVVTICSRRMDVDYIVFSPVIGFCIPVSMTCLSIGLSVRTLVRHIHTMRNSHISSPQLQGHVQAIRTMIIRVYFEISFFVVIVLGTFTSLSSNSTMIAIRWLNALIYPTSQALLLIFGNPKVKKKLCDCLTLRK